MTKYNNSYIGIRDDLIAHIENSESLLDVGCAIGANGKYLKEIGKVKYSYGIEYDKEMAEQASKYYDKVFIKDLNLEMGAEYLSDLTFDTILLGDILEHLLNPSLILKNLVGNLNNEGKIIISLPNIQHIETFIQIYIKGKWPRNKRGIFDKTHLINFTLKNIEELIEECGLKIIKIERNYRFRDAIGSKFPWYLLWVKNLFKNLFTFQYIIVCQKKSR